MKVKLKWYEEKGFDTYSNHRVIAERADTPLGTLFIRLAGPPNNIHYTQPYYLSMPGLHNDTYFATPADAKAYAEELLTFKLQEFIKTCTSNT